MTEMILIFAVVFLLIVCVYQERSIDEVKNDVKNEKTIRDKQLAKLTDVVDKLLSSHDNYMAIHLNTADKIDQLKQKVEYLDLKSRPGQSKMTIEIPDIIRVAHREVVKRQKPLSLRGRQ